MTTAESKRRLLPRWLIWSLMAVVCWGLWAIISKLIGESLSAAQSQALSGLGLLPVMVALVVSGRLAVTGHRSIGIGCALGAGFLACAGNVAYYTALNRGTKAATVVPLTALYPLLTIVLAVGLLREKLNRVQVIGVLLSLAAVGLFNVSTTDGVLSPALGYALVPIALWGVAGFLQKISTNHLSGELSTLWFLSTFVPVAGAILWWEPLAQPIALRVWILAALLGLFFALGNFALLEACASGGKASAVVPLTGLYPLVSVPIALLFFHERITPRESCGIVLALVSVLALSYETPAVRPSAPEPRPADPD